MKIAVLGTRGIPNHYGGFEQFAEFFSVYAVQKGHEVVVYNSHNHPFTEETYKGVQIVKCYDPEYKMGTAGQYIYDLNCILDIRKRKFDVVLQLGYTSSSIWSFLLPRKALIVTNMDGLEWKRTKFSKPVQKLLQFSEKLAVNNSDVLVADSIGIQQHLEQRFGKSSTYIPYGAAQFNDPNAAQVQSFDVHPYQYDLLIARLEPENNVETILDGVAAAKSARKMLVIGNHQTAFGNYLKHKFGNTHNIVFIGSVYDLEKLNNLRYYSNIYFHGHSVGGTNPSLLEAMASQAYIVAHNNIFNKAILKNNADYFSTAEDVADLVSQKQKSDNLRFVSENFSAIATDFSWKKINDAYLQLFTTSLAENQQSKN